MKSYPFVTAPCQRSTTMRSAYMYVLAATVVLLFANPVQAAKTIDITSVPPGAFASMPMGDGGVEGCA